MEKNYSYFKNDKCEYFPCHQTDDSYFNCLFCYCPLYALGEKCGGNFIYTEKGIKDCSQCLIPHKENGYLYVRSKIKEISELAKNK